MKKSHLALTCAILANFLIYSATCEISGSLVASHSSCNSLVSGDTMLITGELILQSDYTAHATKNIVVIVEGGSIVWRGSYEFGLGSNATLYLTKGGTLVNNSGLCNANQVISFGGSSIATCSREGAPYSFDDITLAGGINIGGPVPVSLLSFNFEVLQNSEISLTWVTVSERNNKQFTLLRSSDEVNYEEIYTVKGSGNSSSVSTYSFTDYTPIKSTLFYKLKQEDYDGTTTESKILVAMQTADDISIYPNPMKDQVTVALPKYTKTVVLEISNTLGEVQYSQVVENTSSIKLNTAQLRPGIYMMSVNGKSYKIVKP